MVEHMLERIGLVSWAPCFKDEGFDDLDFLMSLDSSRLRGIATEIGLPAGEAEAFISGIRTEAEQASKQQDNAEPDGQEAILELRAAVALQQEPDNEKLWGRLNTL